MESEKKNKDKTIIMGKIPGEKEGKTSVFNDSEKILEKTAEIFETKSTFKTDILNFSEVPESDSSRFPEILSYRRASVSSSDEKINFDRNFLNDAGPFIFKEFLKEINNEIPPMITGIENLDKIVKIIPSAITSVCGKSRSGKTALLLNLFLNMADIYRDFHYVFYTYGMKKLNIEKLLINISGSTVFNPENPFISKIIKNNNIRSNMDIWELILRSYDEDKIRSELKNREDMKGLDNFLQLSNRLHIIDRCYDIKDLLKSIELFDTSHLKIGAIFIDSAHLINSNLYSNNNYSVLQSCSVNALRSDSFKRNFPFILSYSLPTSEREVIFENSLNYIETNNEPFNSKDTSLKKSTSDFNLQLFKIEGNEKRKITLSIDKNLLKLK